MQVFFNKLTELHQSIDPRARVDLIGDRLVQDPWTKEPVWKSYIPFVGPSYQRGRLLILGTAQNLAKVAKSAREAEWREATGLPDMSLYRLYRAAGATFARPLRKAEVSFSSIAIQPYMDGILAGVAGMALLAMGRGTCATLDDATQYIAVTNFFKHSLRTPVGNDLNPSQLPKELQTRYRAATLRHYVLEEISILKPIAIVTFSDIVADEIRSSWKDGPVYRIYDPAYIKRGASLRQWSHYLTEIPGSVSELIRSYVSQMKQPYQGGKSLAATNYLAKYYAEFKGRA